MTRPPVFCFDLDDTLVSEGDYVESGLRAAGAVLDAEAPGHEPAGAWLVALWRRERARDGFQRLLQERGLAVERWLPRLKEAYRVHSPVLELRAGASELLRAITDRGGRLALVSDGELDTQRRKWAALNLPCAFDPVVFTDEMGRDRWKPHPWAFERVMRSHPGADRFFYVADNPVKDFIAPNRLRWTTVLVRDERNLHPCIAPSADAAPSVTLGSLGAVMTLLAQT